MQPSDSARSPLRLVLQSVAGRRTTPALVVFLIIAVLAQTMLPSSRAGASPRPSTARGGSLPRPKPVPRIHPAPKQSPFASEILNQVKLHQGTAPGSHVPRAAINAATGATARASFTVSAAVRHLLTSTLGLSLRPGSRMVGGIYSHYVVVPVGAPTLLRFGLPSGYQTPVFRDGVVVNDTRTGTLTFVAQSTGGLGASFSLAIPHAATTTLASSRDVVGAFEIPELPVLGGTVSLKGTAGYDGDALQLVATSSDTTATRLGDGRVSVSPDLQVTLDNRRGLTVNGRATVGSGHAALQEELSGTVTGAQDWSLHLTPIAHSEPWQPLAGLVVQPSFAGTVSDHAGHVAFDVTSSRPVEWSPVAATAEAAAHIEYSDTPPPAGQALPAGYHPGDTWVGTDGNLTVSAGSAGTFRGAGGLAVDLSTGHAVVDATGSTPLSAGTFAHRSRIGGEVVSGTLDVRAGTLVGALRVSTPHNGTLAIDRGLLQGGLSAPTAQTPKSNASPVPPPAHPLGGVNLLPAPAHASASNVARAAAQFADVNAGSVASTSYTISSALYNFLNSTLGVSLSSSTLQGTLSGSTLAVNLGSPTNFTLPLPTGSATLAFGATTLSIDESTNTLTLTSSAAAGGATATLTGTIANANTSTLVGTTDLSATVSITGLSVLGVPINLTGGLTYNGTSVSFSVTGGLAAAVTLTSGVVLENGATFTLSSVNGLSVNGTVELGSGATVIPVSVAGTLAGVSDWTLTVSDPGASPWQPEPGLTITPDFTGTLKDTSGAITFDIKTANTVAWQPAPNVALNVTSLEVSNDAPPSSVSCPSGLDDKTLWVDAQGSATYTPPGSTSPLVNLKAQACLVPTQESFKLTSEATGNLAPPAGSSFTLTDVALDVTGNFSTDAFSVDGSASLGGVGTSPTLTVGVAFDTDGSFQAGVALPDLSTLGISGLSGSGAIWLSTKDVPNFVPSSITGFTSNTAFHLRQGLNATLTYSLPTTEQSDLTSWGIPVPQSVTAVASISGAGVTLNIDLDFGGGETGPTIFNTGGAAVYLNQITLGVVLGSAPELTIGGTATLHLPSVTGDANSKPSDVSITLTAAFELDSLNITVGISITGECNGAPCPWQNAFGIQGLTIGTFAASIGVEFGDGIPLPTLSFDLDDVTLPTAIAQPIGLQPDADISIDVNFDLDAPIVHFGLTAPNGQAALYPLQITGDSNIEDAIAIDTADFWLAPLGGTLADQQVVTPGASIKFQATFGGVPVLVYAAVNLSTFSIDATISIGSFNLGPVTFSAGPGQPAVLFKLHLGTDGFTFEFEGGFSFTGFNFSASINLSAVSSFFGASASLSITAGLPQYLQLGANLNGSFSIDSSGLNLSASGSGYIIIAGHNLGSVSFGFSFNSGMLWGAITQAYQQVAEALQNAYNWTATQITQALAGLQYDATQVASALNYIGVQAAQIAQDIVQFFSGTSDGSLAYYLQEAGLTPEQIGNALKSAFADVDSTVAYWLNQLGYSADQIGQTLQSVFNEVGTQVAYVFDEIGMTASQITQTLSDVFYYAQYQILNALGNLGITAQTVINALTSFFTGDGSYWIGTSDALVLDVSGASTSWGTQVIQWYWNGGYNQEWFVIPTDSGYAEIVNRNSGQCLSVAGNSNSPGTSLIQWPCWGGYGQQWYIGNGTYPGWSEQGWNAGIESRLNPGQNVDISGASPWAGAWIDQWWWNSGWNQWWHFTQAIG